MGIVVLIKYIDLMSYTQKIMCIPLLSKIETQLPRLSFYPLEGNFLKYRFNLLSKIPIKLLPKRVIICMALKTESIEQNQRCFKTEACFDPSMAEVKTPDTF